MNSCLSPRLTWLVFVVGVWSWPETSARAEPKRDPRSDPVRLGLNPYRLPALGHSVDTSLVKAPRRRASPELSFQTDPKAVHLGPLDSALAVPLESLGLLALVTYTGFSDWKWGSASFRFNSEGWFSMDTGSGGMDKVGHAYGAYMSSEFLYWRLRVSAGDRPVVSYYPAVFGTLLYLYIETFDGYSVDHGFAYEDVIMNTSGVLLSLLRNTFPVVQRAFDYRLEYFPSKGFDFHPVIDYEGQKFLGAFKFGVFPRLAQSPLRFLEFLLGYYTRGFDKDLDARFSTAHVFFGLGANLEQLVFKPLDKAIGWPFGFMGLASNYFQLPGTYVHQETTRTKLNY